MSLPTPPSSLPSPAHSPISSPTAEAERAPLSIATTTTYPQPELILCADGGGSKVCVVIRTSDGLEVRGTAGPCNVQSVGHIPAADRLVEATYRALSLLPLTHLPPGFAFPTSPTPTPLPNLLTIPAIASNRRIASPSPVPSGTSTPRIRPPPLPKSLFKYCWVALAGISTPADAEAFMPYVAEALAVAPERVTISNDVNLLAGPALHLQGISHVVAVVCGTGTVGRTIRVQGGVGVAPHSPPSPPSPQSSQDDAAHLTNGKTQQRHGLPLEDVGVSRGWGYMLCDEGSAFWIGRLAIRSLLSQWDRYQSLSIHSSPPPPWLPLHADLLEYFAVDDPTDLIGIVSLIGQFFDGLTTGEASAKRNAYMAGAARVVFKWAFPSDSGVDITMSPENGESHEEALRIAQSSIGPVVDLTLTALGDRTVVSPSRAALALGGGLMNSPGYRALLLAGLKDHGVQFRDVLLVDDAAGEGAKALAAVEF